MNNQQKAQARKGLYKRKAQLRKFIQKNNRQNPHLKRVAEEMGVGTVSVMTPSAPEKGPPVRPQNHCAFLSESVKSDRTIRGYVKFNDGREVDVRDAFPDYLGLLNSLPSNEDVVNEYVNFPQSTADSVAFIPSDSSLLTPSK